MAIIRKAYRGELQGLTDHKALPKNIDTLSDRQLAILHLIGQGQRTATIAARLNISPKTVETHRARLIEKLGLNGSRALLEFAISWLRHSAE